MKFKKLTAHGFSHGVLLLLIVVICAIVGVGYLVASRASTGWTNWSTLPNTNPTVTSLYGPAITSWAPGRLDAFTVGANDHNLHHRYYCQSSAVTGCAGAPQYGQWSNWENLGGYITSAPAAISRTAGIIDIFVRGGDNNLWHMAWNGSGWTSWDNRGSIGGGLASAPSVASWGVGRLDIFARDNKGNMAHYWWAGYWGSWEEVGGPIINAPSAVSRSANIIDIFADSTTGILKHMAWNGSGWTAWNNLVNAPNSSGPAASSWGAGRMDVFYVGVQGNMNHIYWDGAWELLSSPENLGGGGNSGNLAVQRPAAVSWGTNQINLLATDVNGALDGRAWTTIATAPAPAPPPPPPGPLTSYSGPSTPKGYVVGCSQYSSSAGCLGKWWYFHGGPEIYDDSTNQVLPNMIYIDDGTYPCSPALSYSAEQTCLNNLVETDYANYVKTYNSAPIIYVGVPGYVGPPGKTTLAINYRFTHATELYEWYPAYTSNATVPCGAQGYIVQRFFNGTDGSGPQYTNFNKLWLSAANGCGPSTKPLAWW